ncbi:hypothetical protein [Paracoccus litorisediminis]|nr:hypothetical protein [Paracoccus litorisediminis]
MPGPALHASPAAALQLTLLGGFAAQTNGQALALPTTKARLLLLIWA